MKQIEFLTEEIEEVIEGRSFDDDEQFYDLFLFKLKNNIYILYYAIINNETEEIIYSIMKEFDDLEMAKKDFEEYNFKE